MSSRIPNAFGASVVKYDLIVKGGRVIDPSRKPNAIRSMPVAAGSYRAIEASINADALETIDARGKLVVPGLIDIHPQRFLRS